MFSRSSYPSIVSSVLAATLVCSGCVSSQSSTGAPVDETTQSVPADCVPAAALDAYIQLRWDRRVDQWNAVDVPEDAIVFLGSSIIEEGNWSRLFPDATILNRGISADTTEGVLSTGSTRLSLRSPARCSFTSEEMTSPGWAIHLTMRGGAWTKS